MVFIGTGGLYEQVSFSTGFNEKPHSRETKNVIFVDRLLLLYMMVTKAGFIVCSCKHFSITLLALHPESLKLVYMYNRVYTMLYVCGHNFVIVKPDEIRNYNINSCIDVLLFL